MPKKLVILIAAVIAVVLLVTAAFATSALRSFGPDRGAEAEKPAGCANCTSCSSAEKAAGDC